MHGVRITYYMRLVLVFIKGMKRSLISCCSEIDAFKGEGVSHLYGKHKTNYHTEMQFACLLNSVHSRLLLGWHAKYLAVGEKRTWVVASKYNIVHTQCKTHLRPVMVRMKCTFELSFVHAGGRAQTLEDSLCETRDFRKHKASPSLLCSLDALKITAHFKQRHAFLVL